MQVRGIELAGGRLFADSAPQVADAKLCAVQGTKLQYVSNRPFTDAELVDLCAKIRSGILEDLPFADVHERIEAMHASLQNVQNVPPQAAAAAAAPAASLEVKSEAAAADAATADPSAAAEAATAGAAQGAPPPAADALAASTSSDPAATSAASAP